MSLYNIMEYEVIKQYKENEDAIKEKKIKIADHKYDLENLKELEKEQEYILKCINYFNIDLQKDEKLANELVEKTFVCKRDYCTLQDQHITRKVTKSNANWVTCTSCGDTIKEVNKNSQGPTIIFRTAVPSDVFNKGGTSEDL